MRIFLFKICVTHFNYIDILLLYYLLIHIIIIYYLNPKNKDKNMKKNNKMEA